MREGRGNRGFILLIVMTALVAITVAVGIFYAQAGAQRIVQVRQEEAVRARAVAGRCLNKAFAVALRHLATASDFDGLLDPNGIPDDGDEYVPGLASGYGAGSVVYIPTGEGAEAEPRRGLHRWLLKGEGTTACLVRFDDNHEAGGENYLDDQDAMITVTSIGIVPFDPSAPPADAYARAHARVTVRRVMGSGSAGPRAVMSADDLNAGSNVSVCGATGGMSVGDNYFGSPSVCTCGDIASVPLPANLTGCCAGDCPGSSSAMIALGAAPPGPLLPPPPAFNHLSGLQVNGGAGPDTNGVCEFWIRDRDALNPTTSARYEAAGDYLASAGEEAWVYLFDSNNPACSDAAVTFGAGLVKRPCRWSGGVATCGAEETDCWYPVARLGTCLGCADLRLDGASRLDALSASPPGPANATLLSDVCDCAGGTCTGTNPVFGVQTSHADRTVQLFPAAATDAPASAIVLWELEEAPAPYTTLTSNVAYLNTTQALKMTHLVQGKLFAQDNAKMCCADCDCSLPCPNADHRGKELIRASEACFVDNGFTLRGDITCGSIQLDNAGSCGVGDLSAFNTVPGYLGSSADIFTPGDAANTCNFNLSGADCGHMGLCLGNQTSWTGNMKSAGDVCKATGASNLARDTLTGIVHAGNDIAIRRYNTIRGQVVGRDDISFEHDVTVRFDIADAAYALDVVSGFGAVGSGGWVEGSW